MTASVLIYTTPSFKDIGLMHDKLNEMMSMLDEDGALEITLSWIRNANMDSNLYNYAKANGLLINIVHIDEEEVVPTSSQFVRAGVVKGSQAHFLCFWVPGERYLVESYINDYQKRSMRLLSYGALM